MAGAEKRWSDDKKAGLNARGADMSDVDFDKSVVSILAENAPPGPPQVDRLKALDKLKSILFGSAVYKRTPVNEPALAPWNSVALLNLFNAGSYRGFATGFMLKQDVVVTAGHNLQLSNPSAIGIYPGYDAKLNPVAGFSGRAWAWHGVRDIAVIVAGGSSAARVGMRFVSGGDVTLAGYAFSYPDNTPRMTTGVGGCSVDGDHLHYRIGVQRGDSGSPVLATDVGGVLTAAVHSEARIDPEKGGLVGVGEAASATLLQIITGLEQRAREKI